MRLYAMLHCLAYTRYINRRCYQKAKEREVTHLRSCDQKSTGSRCPCREPTLTPGCLSRRITQVRDRENVSQQFQARTVDCIKLLHLDARSEGSVESNYMNLCRRSSHGYDFMSGKSQISPLEIGSQDHRLGQEDDLFPPS